MTGRELKIKLKQMGYELAFVASKLGITPQALNSKLNAENLKISFIEEVAEAIKETVYSLISDLPTPPPIYAEPLDLFVQTIRTLQSDVDMLKKEIKELKKDKQ